MPARILLSFFCLSLAMPVMAQDAPTIYTYAAHWEVPRASFAAFEEDNGANAVLDGLVDDGTLIWWSNIETFVHSVEGTTHGNMFAATSLAAIERTLDELGKLPAGPTISGIKHHDHFWRSLVHGGRSADQSGGYMWMTINELQAGRGRDWLNVQKQYFEPVYKELVADGTILTYDIAVQHVHRGNPRTRFTFIVSASAEADEKVNEALDAMYEEHAPAIFLALGNTEIRTEHRDVLFHTANFKHK